MIDEIKKQQIIEILTTPIKCFPIAEAKTKFSIKRRNSIIETHPNIL